MIKNPWFNLVLGMMIGVVVGYVLAEHQRVPPAAATARTGQQAGLPEGHPPLSGAPSADEEQLARQVAALEAKVAESPSDPRPLIMLGNLHFDAGNWQAARMWYERSLELAGSDPDVITDLAVVYRRLRNPDRALELLEKAIGIDPQHVIAWFNKVVVLHHDLHQHEQAAAALERLRKLDPERAGLDLAALEQDVLGATGS